MHHCRRFRTLPFSSTASRFRSRLRHCTVGSPITPGRIEFVILRTGRSPPAALHHASLRRSCIRLQAGERLPEEDLHLSDHLRFQAHDAGSYAPVTILIDERADGVHLSYDRMASLIAPYENAEALEVARTLDDKVEGLLVEAAQ